MMYVCSRINGFKSINRNVFYVVVLFCFVLFSSDENNNKREEI